MLSRLLPEDVITYNSAVSACEKRAEWQQALNILQQLDTARLQPSLITCNSCISACEKAGQWQVALQLLCEVDARYLQPDVITYNSTISAYQKVTQWQVAMSLSHVAELHVGHDIITFNSTLSAAERAGQWQQTLSLLSKMLSCEVRADEISFNVAVTACWTATVLGKQTAHKKSNSGTK